MRKLSVLLFLFPAFTAIGQMNMHGYMHSDSNSSVSTYRNIGVSFFEFDGLNNRMKLKPEYKELPKAMATLGLGTMMEHGHFVGINAINIGYGMNGNKSKNGTSIGFVGLSADAGYNFFRKQSRVAIIPSVGLGVEGYMARFNRDNSALDFDDVAESPELQNDTRPLKLTNGYFTYRFGLNIAGKSKDKTCGFGLQAGYTGGFVSSSWKINDYQSLGNAPQDNLSRFYATLFLTKELRWKNKSM